MKQVSIVFYSLIQLTIIFRFNWVFADEVFTTAATRLRENGIELADLRLDAVKEYNTEQEIGEEEIEGKAANDILFIPESDSNLVNIRDKLKNDYTSTSNAESGIESDIRAESQIHP